MSAQTMFGDAVSDAGRQHQEYFQKKVQAPLKDATLEGANKAIDGKPEMDHDDAHVYFEPLQTLFNSLIVENKEMVDLRINQTRSIQYNAKAALNTLLKRKNELESVTQLPNENPASPELAGSGYVHLGISIIIAIIIMVSEWVLLGESFQVLSKSKPFALLMGAGFALVIAVILHYGKYLVDSIKSSLMKRNATVLGLGLIAIGIIEISFLRADFIETTHKKNLNAFTFTVINFIFTGGFYLLIRYGFQEALRKIQKRKHRVTDLLNPQQELAEVNERIEQLSKERDDAQALERETEVLSKTTELRLLRAYFECIAAYKLSNITTRNAVPNSFWNSFVPPLQFYFISKHEITH